MLKTSCPRKSCHKIGLKDRTKRKNEVNVPPISRKKALTLLMLVLRWKLKFCKKEIALVPLES